MDMFSTTPADSRQAVQGRLRLCKILSVISRRRGNWRIDCTRYGLFPSDIYRCNSHDLFVRYCIPTDSSRPQLDLEGFSDIRLDNLDNDGTSKCYLTSYEIGLIGGIFQVPVVAVFTKYDQFKIDTMLKLEDENRYDEDDFDEEVEKRFDQRYLYGLGGHPLHIRLEGEVNSH